jgi:hypothetical protein
METVETVSEGFHSLASRNVLCAYLKIWINVVKQPASQATNESSNPRVKQQRVKQPNSHEINESSKQLNRDHEPVITQAGVYLLYAQERIQPPVRENGPRLGSGSGNCLSLHPASSTRYTNIRRGGFQPRGGGGRTGTKSSRMKKPTWLEA